MLGSASTSPRGFSNLSRDPCIFIVSSKMPRVDWTLGQPHTRHWTCPYERLDMTLGSLNGLNLSLFVILVFWAKAFCIYRVFIGFISV